MRNSKFVLLVLITLNLFALTKEHFQAFYDPYIVDVSNKLNNTTTPLTLQQRIQNLGLNLWVYQSGITKGTADNFTTEYNNLVKFIKANNITKIIYYPEYSSSNAFFDPTSTDAESLVQLLQSNPIPSSCVMEVQFDKSSNFSGYTVAGSYTLPTQVDTTNYTGANAVTTGTASYFQDLTTKLGWVLDLRANLPARFRSTISGITIDPEGSGLSGPGVVTTAYQKIANYIDSYLIANNQLGILTNNMTFGISSVTPSFGNRSPLPLAGASAIGTAVTGGQITSFPLNSQPPWRTSSQTTPILDNVYIQAYQSDMPYIFTSSLNNLSSTDPTAGSVAATRMLKLLTETPYVVGVGTVDVSNTSGPSPKAQLTAASGAVDFTTAAKTAVTVATNCTGSGFTSSAIIQFSPIAVISNNVQVCVIPDQSQPSNDLKCAGKIPATATLTSTLELQAPTSTEYTDVQWLFSEVLASWRTLESTAEMVSGITFLFSGEYYHPTTFFGQWPLTSFVNFVESFKSQGQTFGLFRSSTDSTLPIGPNIGMYSYDLVNGTFEPSQTNLPANPPQRYIWFNPDGTINQTQPTMSCP